ncbi:16S rRNA (uracil(1498)-N(3))-methyltransferase [Actomonas aquatica]|uniref:Ribosomal RNA small subunit methyltransferase E n=1 Tax=Actomonas aquatica TaxID=2866162 RepID=A0ABZ1CDK2_9BACT|nr:RsmE family RNA methyltransferase [Opitutus sp. WL0086]WRQ89759.1 RsmE family RNA methyltransferase [Opitutus sp. WL0086]
MNIVLFDPSETAPPLPRSDERARHILKVLRRSEGDNFDVGLINGPRGKATLRSITEDALHLDFTWDAPHPPPPATTLVVGLPRPQTARDILRDATTLGVTQIHFVRTARSDINYADSSLWQDEAWRRHLVLGAAQAFDTHLPRVTCAHDLSSALGSIHDATTTLALDNYGAEVAMAEFPLPTSFAHVVLCLGPERGWDDADREVLARFGAVRAHLGTRVLRLETAVVAGLTLLHAARHRVNPLV